jgi:hypothetical protein
MKAHEAAAVSNIGPISFADDVAIGAESNARITRTL